MRADNDAARMDIMLSIEPTTVKAYTLLFLSNPSCGPKSFALVVVEAGALPVAVEFDHVVALATVLTLKLWTRFVHT